MEKFFYGSIYPAHKLRMGYHALVKSYAEFLVIREGLKHFSILIKYLTRMELQLVPLQLCVLCQNVSLCFI